MSEQSAPQVPREPGSGTDEPEELWTALATPVAGPVRPRRAPRRGLALTLVAIIALGAGAGTTILVRQLLATPASSEAAAAGPATGPSSAGGPGSGAGGTLPSGAPGGSGPVSQLFLIGTVRAVTATSLTIGGPGGTVTAAITSATRVTGQAAGITSVRVGDSVSAQITSSGGTTRVTALQDPARVPG
jgi:hypothetical protein